MKRNTPRAHTLTVLALMAITSCKGDWRDVRKPPPRFEVREVVDDAALLAPLQSLPACSAVDFFVERVGDREVPYAGAKHREVLADCVRHVGRPGLEVALSPERELVRTHVLRAEAVISGADLARARLATFDDRPFLEVELTGGASKKLFEFTKAHVGRRMAIVVNGEVKSVPQIAAPIDTKTLKLSVDTRADGEAGLRALSEAP